MMSLTNITKRRYANQVFTYEINNFITSFGVNTSFSTVTKWVVP